jgi:hypothetical protein
MSHTQQVIGILGSFGSGSTTWNRAGTIYSKVAMPNTTAGLNVEV